MKLDDLKSTLTNLLNQTVERGCTPDEAANAANILNRLLEKYQLSLADLPKVGAAEEEMGDERPQYVSYRGNNLGRSKMPEYLKNLARAIGQTNFCEVLEGDAPWFLGAKKDCELATYLFAVLLRKMQEQARVDFAKYRKQMFPETNGVIPRNQAYGANHSVVWHNSWMEGAANAITSKLQDELRERRRKEREEQFRQEQEQQRGGVDDPLEGTFGGGDVPDPNERHLAVVLTNRQEQAKRYAASKFPWLYPAKYRPPEPEQEQEPEQELAKSEDLVPPPPPKPLTPKEQRAKERQERKAAERRAKDRERAEKRWEREAEREREKEYRRQRNPTAYKMGFEAGPSITADPGLGAGKKHPKVKGGE